MLQGSSRLAFRDPSGTCIFRYFQEISIYTLDNLYDFNRDEAYASCVSVLPFKWGKHVTPLSIADDACAMKFMGHSCSQTFLNLVWLQYMDLDTAHWKVGVRDGDTSAPIGSLPIPLALTNFSGLLFLNLFHSLSHYICVFVFLSKTRGLNRSGLMYIPNKNRSSF